MAIRKLTTLSSTEVADGAFRSLTEVDRYLESVKENLTNLESIIRQYQAQFAKAEKASTEFVINREGKPGSPAKRPGGGKAIGLDKVVVPKLDALRKNFTVVEEISDQVDMLETLFNSVSVNFQGVRGANDTLKNIKAMRKAAQAKMQAALNFLNTVGVKYIPTEFKQMVEATIGYVSPNLVFEKHETFIYAYETKDEHLAFSVYIKLYGLEDDEGMQHPQFYIVFTCVLKPTSGAQNKVDAFYYVTAMSEFSPPGKYLLGKSIEDPAKASAALGIMLELENVSTAIGILPHNLDATDLKKNKFSVGSMVAKINVDPNTITFEMLKSVSQEAARKAAATLYTEMKGILGRIKKARLKAKIYTDAGRQVIQFTLTNLAREDQVSLTDIDFLKEHFPQLDDRKVRQVVKVINSD